MSSNDWEIDELPDNATDEDSEEKKRTLAGTGRAIKSRRVYGDTPSSMTNHFGLHEMRGMEVFDALSDPKIGTRLDQVHELSKADKELREKSLNNGMVQFSDDEEDWTATTHFDAIDLDIQDQVALRDAKLDDEDESK